MSLIIVNKNDNLQAGDKASRVKTLTSKSDSLGSTAMTHTVGETQLLHTAPLASTQGWHTLIHTIKNK